MALITPKVVDFAADLAKKFIPGANIVGWAQTAYMFYNLIKGKITELIDTIKSLKMLFAQLVGDTSPAELGKKFSDLVQANLPVVFDVLATALGFAGIKDLPAQAISKVRNSLEMPIVNFLSALAKPILSKIPELTGSATNPNGYMVLTPPVALNRDSKRMAWLAKTSDGVHVFISGSAGVQQPDKDPNASAILSAATPLVTNSGSVASGTGNASAARQALGSLAAITPKLKDLVPTCGVSPGHCFAAEERIDDGRDRQEIKGKWDGYWLGRRVATWKPGESGYEQSLTIPDTWIDPDRYRVIWLVQEKEEHRVVAGLLRSLDWLAEQGIVSVGAWVELNMPEMGAEGEFQLVAINDCPEIEEGPGRIVTGWFHHRRGSVYDLFVEGETKPIGVTEMHPFWSPDRKDWVPASELLVGERVLVNGGFRVIKGMTEAGEEQVCNLQVEADHCYRVGEQGILVHNASFTITDYRANLHPVWDYRTKRILDQVAYDEYVPMAIYSRQNSTNPQALRKGSNLAILKTQNVESTAVMYAPIFNDKNGLHSEQIISNMYKGKFGPGTTVVLSGLFTERAPCNEAVCGAVILDLYRDNCAAFSVYYVIPAGMGSDLILQAFYKNTNPTLDRN